MNLLEQADALAAELRFAEYIRNKLTGVRLVHEHERVTFERILRLAAERICPACRGYGKTLSGCHCDTCNGKGGMDVAKAPAETTPAPERAELEAWKVAHNADCTCTRSIPGMKGPHKVGCPAGVRLGEPQAPCVKCGTAPLLPPPAPAPLCWSHDHEGQ